MLERPYPKRFRTLVISDVHLGCRGCQADALLDFLRQHEAERIHLDGDIVDGWRLRKGWYWPQEHNDDADADGFRYINSGDWVENCAPGTPPTRSAGWASRSRC